MGLPPLRTFPVATAPHLLRVVLRKHIVLPTASAGRRWSSAEAPALISHGMQATARVPVEQVSHGMSPWKIHGLALLILNVIANPSGGKAIVACGSGTFSCEYNGCLQGNFSLSQGEPFLRENQRLPVAPMSTASSSSAAANPTKQVPMATVSSVCSTNATPGEAKPAAAHGKLVAVGAGIGVPLAVALLVAVTMLLREKRRNQYLTREKGWLAAEADQHKREVQQQKVRIASQNAGVSELSGMSEPAELVSKSVRY